MNGEVLILIVIREGSIPGGASVVVVVVVVAFVGCACLGLEPVSIGLFEAF
jgi:hypothetical protein